MFTSEQLLPRPWGWDRLPGYFGIASFKISLEETDGQIEMLRHTQKHTMTA